MVTVDQREILLVLMQFLHEETDENNPMTRKEILRRLGEKGYRIARKQFNSDIAIMQKRGIDIVEIERGNGNAYYWGERLFGIDELQILADSVTSCKYLTEKRTQNMIGRLGNMTSRFQAAMLRKNVCMTGHVKSIDDSILLNVGVIHKAMNAGKKISLTWCLILFFRLFFHLHLQDIFRLPKKVD